MLTPEAQRLVRARQKRMRKEIMRSGVAGLTVRLGDRCPACGSCVVVEGPCDVSVPMDTCVSCGALWERETRANPVAEQCSECAFLPGSPEQQDPEEWRKIIAETVQKHGMFLCHKRVPFTFDAVDGKIDYRFRDADGKVQHGTPCAGWLRAACTAAGKRAT